MRVAVLFVAFLTLAPARGQDERVPIERLPAEVRAEVRAIQAGATVHAEIPIREVRCKASVYRTLLGSLPQCSRWLRVLELGDYAISDLPDGTFRIDDRAGAKATCTRALDEEGRLVIVARGTLDVPVLPSIAGTGVIHVRYVPTAKDEGLLRCSAVVDFRLDSGLLHALSRPFKRTLSRVLADKMALLIRSAIELSEAIEKDPVEVYRQLESRGAAKADLKAFRSRFLRL